MFVVLLLESLLKYVQRLIVGWLSENKLIPNDDGWLKLPKNNDPFDGLFT
jgi:hypothetical protein